MRALAIAAIMLVLALGCSSAGPAQAHQPSPPPAQVTLGMAAAQVENLMGKPRQVLPVAADPGMQLWLYDAGKVLLNNGKVALTDPSPLPVP